MNNNQLGEMLTQVRKSKKLGQRQASRLIGISDTWLRWIEKGEQPFKGGTAPVRPGVETCFDIAAAYGLEASDVLALAGHDPESVRPIPAAPKPSPVEPMEAVIDAILADRRLVPEARMHLANQYALLLRIGADRTDTDVRATYDEGLLAELAQEPTAAERLRAQPPEPS